MCLDLILCFLFVSHLSVLWTVNRFVYGDLKNGRCCANYWWPMQMVIGIVDIVRRPSDDLQVEAP